jgi:glutamate-1-semialdehyde 2,1-aminomutase
MFTPFFVDALVDSYEAVRKCDTERFASFFHGLTGRGVYLPPSQFEAAFVSAAHTEDDIGRTLEAVEKALKPA